MSPEFLQKNLICAENNADYANTVQQNKTRRNFLPDYVPKIM